MPTNNESRRDQAELTPAQLNKLTEQLHGHALNIPGAAARSSNHDSRRRPDAIRSIERKSE